MSYSDSFPYKHIIVDEGQDFGQKRIEEANILDILETIVLDEDRDGTYYVFYDKNQLIQGWNCWCVWKQKWEKIHYQNWQTELLL